MIDFSRLLSYSIQFRYTLRLNNENSRREDNSRLEFFLEELKTSVECQVKLTHFFVEI